MVRFGDTADTHTHTHLDSKFIVINILTNCLLQFTDEQGKGRGTLLIQGSCQRVWDVKRSTVIFGLKLPQKTALQMQFDLG